jgi:hypothetical protein
VVQHKKTLDLIAGSSVVAMTEPKRRSWFVAILGLFEWLQLS